MNRILLCFALATFAAEQCYSGAFTADPRTLSVFIALNDGTVGSGCMIGMSNSVYLVTAKHVLFLPTQGTNAPALRSPGAVVKGFVPSGTNSPIRVFAIGLEQLLKAGDVRYSTNRDIAMVRVEDCDTNDPNHVSCLPGVAHLTAEGNLAVAPQSAVWRAKDIDVGGDVFMFGYPVSLTGAIADRFDPSEPLLRKGIVAGVNLEKNTVIIDCPAYFGNSGGPVIEITRPNLTEIDYRLIGIVSAFIPFQEEWENKTMGYSHVLKSNSGYTLIEPMDSVLDLVWK